MMEWIFIKWEKHTGNRSAQAAKKLVEAGYTQIYDFGGIMDWPYDTVSGEE